jgi:uncharacterized protein YndB with AHSA1/START domain
MTKLKWLWMAVAILAAVLFALALLGSLLPSRHVARASLTLNQPPDSVWSVIRDFEAYPSWWTRLKAMTRIPGRSNETWAQRDKYGDEILIEVVESQPARRLVTRIAAEDLPYSGTWTYELTASVDGTTLTITEDGEIYNPIFRLMARFVFGYHATVDAFLQAIGRRFGQPVPITHHPTG